jgi:RNA polymerase sigma-70 factor (ECF subfamily)
MAILVMLERLTPVERAVRLLHDVFDFSRAEIAALVSRSAAASRKLLERTRRRTSEGRRLITASREEHRRLLDALLEASSAGDVAALTQPLATDAVPITDGGPEGRASTRRRAPPWTEAAGLHVQRQVLMVMDSTRPRGGSRAWSDTRR